VKQWLIFATENAIVVIDNTAAGPAIGGTRMSGGAGSTQHDAVAHARDRAGERAAALVHAAEAELARARQAEAGACDQVRHARDDAVRERDALAEQYRARLEAAGHLAAAERDRAVRAEQLLDAEREHHHRLLAVLATAAGGGDDRTAPARAPAPAARRPRAGATARDTP
jgi:hypothetical protein